MDPMIKAFMIIGVIVLALVIYSLIRSNQVRYVSKGKVIACEWDEEQGQYRTTLEYFDRKGTLQTCEKYFDNEAEIGMDLKMFYPGNDVSNKPNYFVIIPFLVFFFGGWFGLLYFFHYTMTHPDAAPLNTGVLYPIVIGTLLVLVGFYILYEVARRSKLEKNADVRGVIVGTQAVEVPRGNGMSSTRYCAVVEYTDRDGIRSRFQAKPYYYNEEDIPVGEEVSVFPGGKIGMVNAKEDWKPAIAAALIAIAMGAMVIGIGLENFGSL